MINKARVFGDKRYSGYVWHFIFAGLFIGLSLLFLEFIHGVVWFTISSVLRIIFGTAILITVNKLFGKKPSDVLSLKNTGKALLAGSGFLLFFLYYISIFITGFGGITGLTIEVFLTRMILMQITTGFYEELNYRFLLLEGLKHTKNSLGLRVALVFVSSILFGLLHCVTGWNTYTFFQTGALGFAFAVIFVKSGNIVVPMVIHFIYDVLAHTSNFIEWNHSAVYENLCSVFTIMLGVMFVVSLVILVVDRPSGKVTSSR